VICTQCKQHHPTVPEYCHGVPIEVNSASFVDSPSRLQRWRHIRRIAIRLFDERGFAAVSIDDITAAAGVSRRTFFNYFATKGAVLFDPDPEESHRLGELLHGKDPAVGLWHTLTQVLLEYFGEQEMVITARRSILGVDPALDPQHMLANAQFEESLLIWLAENSVRDYRARLSVSIALAVVRESFRSWQPTSGYRTFLDSLADGFAFAGPGSR
jgi:AcrR family transcriptional regulator